MLVKAQLGIRMDLQSNASQIAVMRIDSVFNPLLVLI